MESWWVSISVFKQTHPWGQQRGKSQSWLQPPAAAALQGTPSEVEGCTQSSAGHQRRVDGRWTQAGPGSMQLMMIAAKHWTVQSYNHCSMGFWGCHLRHKSVLRPLGKDHQCRGTRQWVLMCCWGRPEGSDQRRFLVSKGKQLPGTFTKLWLIIFDKDRHSHQRTSFGCGTSSFVPAGPLITNTVCSFNLAILWTSS